MKNSNRRDEIVNLINEIIEKIKPIYSKPGWFTDDDEIELSKLGFDISITSFYDGKTINFIYKDVDCHFQKFDALYLFEFGDCCVEIYEDYMLSSDRVYNDCEYEETFTSIVPFITDFPPIFGCYGKCKVIVGYEFDVRSY